MFSNCLSHFNIFCTNFLFGEYIYDWHMWQYVEQSCIITLLSFVFYLLCSFFNYCKKFVGVFFFSFVITVLKYLKSIKCADLKVTCWHFLRMHAKCQLINKKRQNYATAKIINKIHRRLYWGHISSFSVECANGTARSQMFVCPSWTI